MAIGGGTTVLRVCAVSDGFMGVGRGVDLAAEGGGTRQEAKRLALVPPMVGATVVWRLLSLRCSPWCRGPRGSVLNGSRWPIAEQAPQEDAVRGELLSWSAFVCCRPLPLGNWVRTFRDC